MFDSFTLGRSGSALARFGTEVEPGETDAQAEARMERLMTKILPRFVSE